MTKLEAWRQRNRRWEAAPGNSHLHIERGVDLMAECGDVKLYYTWKRYISDAAPLLSDGAGERWFIWVGDEIVATPHYIQHAWEKYREIVEEEKSKRARVEDDAWP